MYQKIDIYLLSSCIALDRAWEAKEHDVTDPFSGLQNLSFHVMRLLEGNNRIRTDLPCLTTAIIQIVNIGFILHFS